VGERFRGRITNVQPFGLFVQIETYLVDGLVPIRTLGDDYYVYEPESHRLVGDNHGRVFQLADRLEVELTGVSLRHRGLDLKIVGVPAPEPRNDWPRGRSDRGGERGDRGDRADRGDRRREDGARPQRRRRSSRDRS
jgi:ribonuclease R